MLKSDREFYIENEIRLSFKPGYRISLFDHELRIEGNGDRISDADHTNDSQMMMPDIWDSGVIRDDLTHFDAATIAALREALHSAIHEVFEWFAVDRKRLVDAHDTRLMKQCAQVSNQLALWAWERRKRMPGKPYPAAWLPKEG